MEDPEALRRRLYAPGAGDGDLDAYRRVARPPEDSPEEPVGARPGRSRLLPLGGLLVVLLAAALVVALLPRPVTAPTAQPVPVSAEDRADLLAGLGTGGAAGIAAYLVTHPSPSQFAGLGAFATQEVHGVGDGERGLDPTAAEGRTRATVLLVTDSPARATWTALRLTTRSGSRVVQLQPVATRSQESAAGTLTATTFRVADGAVPVRLRIEAAPGVRWGAAVVWSRPTGS